MKIFFSICFLLGIIACHSGKKVQSGLNTNIDPAKDYETGLLLVAKQDCATCHALDRKSVAPSYKQIAEKYSGKEGRFISSLSGKIISGGSGNWGEVPMTPHPNLSIDSAAAIVKYILLTKNKS